MKQDQTLSWIVRLAAGFLVYLFGVSLRAGKDLMLEIAGFLMLLPFMVAVGMLFWALGSMLMEWAAHGGANGAAQAGQVRAARQLAEKLDREMEAEQHEAQARVRRVEERAGRL